MHDFILCEFAQMTEPYRWECERVFSLGGLPAQVWEAGCPLPWES
jgi:hypothetical protein